MKEDVEQNKSLRVQITAQAVAQLNQCSRAQLRVPVKWTSTHQEQT